MNVEGFEALLRGLESGAVRVVARDLTEPSPLALEALTARPYAYLDDAPLEERRTQAVMSRRWIDPVRAADSASWTPRPSRGYAGSVAGFGDGGRTARCAAVAHVPHRP